MSIRTIEYGTLGVSQLNSSNNIPSLTIDPSGVVALVSPAQSTSLNADSISTISYVNQQISNSVIGGINAAGSYKWTGAYQIFGNNQLIGIGSSTLPTAIPSGTSQASGTLISGNAANNTETDLYNLSNLKTGGFNFYNTSATSITRQIASLYSSSATNSIFNLTSATGQYQVNGVNILDGVASAAQVALLAPIASPQFTGIPNAPTAPANTTSTQIATCQYVQNAVTASGGFSQNTSYTWGSAYQLFGNNQIISIGSSTMPTIFPTIGTTASNQVGAQIGNNLLGNNETDFVNYSNNNIGGFAFVALNNTFYAQAVATLRTTTPTSSFFNLTGADSQFTVNNVNIARQITPTYVSTNYPAGNFTWNANSGPITATSNSAHTVNYSTINGVTTVNFYSSLYSAYSPVQYTANSSQYIPLGDFSGAPFPTNSFSTSSLYVQNSSGSLIVSIPISLILVPDTVNGSSWVLVAPSGYQLVVGNSYSIANFSITYS